MVEEKIESVMLWVAPDGTFKGKEEVKRLLTGEAQATPELKIKDAGIGIMVKGNKAVYEYDIEGITSEGMKFMSAGT